MLTVNTKINIFLWFSILIMSFIFLQYYYKDDGIIYDGFTYSKKLSVNDIKNLKKGQEIMTNTLREFDKICRTHNLKYWCDGGTLIGAIRNNGWVPFDGDIDVGMIEEDFKILSTVINKELPNHIRFSPHKKEIFGGPDAKVQNSHAVYAYLLCGHNKDCNMGVKIDIFVFKRAGNNYLRGGGTPKKKMSNTIIFPLKETNFDGISVYIPNNHDAYLKKWFTNYNKLPPIRKRYPHEGNIKIV